MPGHQTVKTQPPTRKGGYSAVRDFCVGIATLDALHKLGTDYAQDKWMLFNTAKDFSESTDLALCFVSFFPQFVIPGGDYQAVSFLALGLTYAMIAYLTDITFALVAGSAAGAVTQNKFLQRLLDLIVGATVIALGVRLAFTRR